MNTESDISKFHDSLAHALAHEMLESQPLGMSTMRQEH